MKRVARIVLRLGWGLILRFRLRGRRRGGGLGRGVVR